MSHVLQVDANSTWCDRCMRLWPISLIDIPVECAPPEPHVLAYLADRAGLRHDYAVAAGAAAAHVTTPSSVQWLNDSAPCAGTAFVKDAPCRCYYIAPELRAAGQRCSPCVARGISA